MIILEWAVTGTNFNINQGFSKKCGKFAAYTGPAIVVLLLFDKKAHAGSGQFRLWLWYTPKFVS
jgi:hypothetical protein